MQDSYVYITASKPNGTLYIGVTTNLAQRIWQHKNKENPGFTQKYNVHMLVYYEVHGDLMEAITRERRLKNWCRKWKLNLIEQFNPLWLDLYDEICA